MKKMLIAIDGSEASLHAARLALTLTVLKDAAAKLGLTAHRALVLVGSAAEQICDLAEQENVDLIVIGSKGRGAVSRMLIGSVTDRTVHISKKPVLVVRE